MTISTGKMQDDNRNSPTQTYEQDVRIRESTGQLIQATQPLCCSRPPTNANLSTAYPLVPCPNSCVNMFMHTNCAHSS